MSNVVDLDAFLAEKKSAAPVFRYKGKTWECPVEIPYVAMLKANSLFGGKSEADIDESDFQVFIELVYGEQVWREMEEVGIGVTALMKIIEATSDYLLTTVPAAPDEPEENGASGPKSQKSASKKK